MIEEAHPHPPTIMFSIFQREIIGCISYSRQFYLKGRVGIVRKIGGRLDTNAGDFETSVFFHGARGAYKTLVTLTTYRFFHFFWVQAMDYPELSTLKVVETSLVTLLLNQFLCCLPILPPWPISSSTSSLYFHCPSPGSDLLDSVSFPTNLGASAFPHDPSAAYSLTEYFREHSSMSVTYFSQKPFRADLLKYN